MAGEIRSLAGGKLPQQLPNRDHDPERHECRADRFDPEFQPLHDPDDRVLDRHRLSFGDGSPQHAHKGASSPLSCRDVPPAPEALRRFARAAAACTQRPETLAGIPSHKPR